MPELHLIPKFWFTIKTACPSNFRVRVSLGRTPPIHQSLWWLSPRHAPASQIRKATSPRAGASQLDGFQFHNHILRIVTNEVQPLHETPRMFNSANQECSFHVGGRTACYPSPISYQLPAFTFQLSAIPYPLFFPPLQVMAARPTIPLLPYPQLRGIQDHRSG